jgi:hypothetical protein
MVGETHYNTVTGLVSIPTVPAGARASVAVRDFDHSGILPKRVVRADAVLTALPAPDALVPDVSLLDFTATSPNKRYRTQPSSEERLKAISLDYSTGLAEKVKNLAFHTSFAINQGHRVGFVAFPIERSGYLGRPARDFLARAGHLLDIHEATGTGRQRTRRDLVEIVSVAWQAGLGAKMSRALQRHFANIPALRRRQLLPANDPQRNPPSPGDPPPPLGAPVGAPFSVEQSAGGAAVAAPA